VSILEDGAPLTPASAQRSAVGNLFLRLIFTVGLIFNFPSFVYELAFDKYSAQYTGSRLLQGIALSTDLFVLAAILISPGVRTLIIKCKPILWLGAIGFISTVWSIDPAQTIRDTHNFLTTSLFTLTLAGLFSPSDSLKIVLQTFTLGCVLSIVWVMGFPADAIHQATDKFQFVHAGLWRGILSHKQQFGIFSGLTLGLLLFFSSVAFSSIVLRLAAVACSLTCLIGSGSVTGMLTPAVLAPMLYLVYWISKRDQNSRKKYMHVLVVFILVLVILYTFGAFDFLPGLLGKSSDMTGRSSFWPYLLAAFRRTSNFLLGAGAGCGPDLASRLAGEDMAVDNGYIEKLLEFGYLGSIVFFLIYGRIAVAAIRLIVNTPPTRAAIHIFPFCFLFAYFVDNITEGEFMKKDYMSILLALTVAQIAQGDSRSPARKRLGVSGDDVRRTVPTRAGPREFGIAKSASPNAIGRG